MVFSPWVISSQPREALPEEGGAGEQLHLTLVAVVLSGPNGFFWVDTSALMLVDPEGFMLLSLSGKECPAPRERGNQPDLKTHTYHPCIGEQRQGDQKFKISKTLLSCFCHLFLESACS